MKTPFFITCAAAAAFMLTGCGGSSSSTPANNSSPVVQPEIYAQNKVDVATLNQAVQQYNAAEGHYPAQLSDLTPTYIAKILDAPQGYKINYDATSGTVTLVQQ